jgi:sterol desaturase/sphingolipid hydroxylase (fatty acid hydroxylase superfamily)
MIQKLADFQPVILIVILLLMYNLERWIPYLTGPVNKKKHDRNNLVLSIISFAINGALSLVVLNMLTQTASKQWGLLNQFNLPSWIKIVLGILLIDFGSYIFHNISHKLPLLWRIHRVHHSDPSINASSSLRFHPIDVVLSQCLWPVFWIVLMGISMTSFIIYGTLALPLLVLQHSNFKIPSWIEKYGRYIFSTPGWHKIHHADEQSLTDSHYGDVFTFWDRIFGTWRPTRPEEIKYGLPDFAYEERQKALFLLKSPFLDLKKRS